MTKSNSIIDFRAPHFPSKEEIEEDNYKLRKQIRESEDYLKGIPKNKVDFITFVIKGLNIKNKMKILLNKLKRKDQPAFTLIKLLGIRVRGETSSDKKRLKTLNELVKRTNKFFSKEHDGHDVIWITSQKIDKKRSFHLEISTEYYGFNIK